MPIPMSATMTDVMASGTENGSFSTPGRCTQSKNTLPMKPEMSDRIASPIIGAVIAAGDSCGCASPRYSPWKVSSMVRVM